jgi:hypothetical protein
MSRKAKAAALLISVAAAAGIAASASAAELGPLQGYAIPLGDRMAAVYFRQQDGHKEVVTTLAPASFQGERVRQVTILEPGKTAAIALLRSGILVLEATDRGATVTIEVRPDLSAGKRVAQVAKFL